MPKFQVITVGSATTDAFVFTNLDEIQLKKDKFIGYPSGSKLLIDELFFDVGGGGTNSAVAFSRLGLKTAFLGCLGKDINSEKILENLRKNNVKFIGFRIDKPTGYSVILDSKEHNRTILTYKGASNFLNFKIKPRKLKTKWFYFSSMTGKSLEMQKKLAYHAKNKNIKIAYNPSEYQVKQHEKIYPILKNTEILVLNKEEAQILCKNNSSDIKLLLSLLHNLGPKIACITDGSKGAYLSTKEMVFRVKPNNIPVIERTGAGDAFASSLVAGIILFSENNNTKEKTIKKALSLALTNSESVIQYLGAKNKLLTLNEAYSKIKTNMKNIIRIK